MTSPGRYARDDDAMERIELARIIHDEKVRDVEATLRRRWLLRREDAEIVTEPTSAPTTAAEGSRTVGAGQPAAPSPARSATAATEGSRTVASPLR